MQLKSHSSLDNLMVRFVLYKNELFQLPPTCQGVQVVSGNAWVSMSEQDIVLSKGEETPLKPSRKSVLVSALGKSPAVVEAW